MILGKVTDDGVPVVTLSVGQRDWTTIIDTGFNGDLELPDGLRGLLQPRFKGQFHSLLAGGQRILEDTFEVQFPFDGELVLAEATFSDSQEILLGTGLLLRHHVEIDFPAHTVRIEKRPSF